MTQSFFISNEYLKQFGPCSEGYAFFRKNFPDGGGEYGDVLNKCYEADRSDWAEWLMGNVTDAETAAPRSSQTRLSIRLGLPGFVRATVDFLWSRTWFDPRTVEPTEGDSEGNHARLASSGYGAQLASSGDSARLASSGYGARLASSGYGAQLASSGNHARLASSGNGAQLASSGYGARLASSGYGAQLASSGNHARLASSGNHARLASSGYGARLASSGDSARLDLEGDHSVGAAVGPDSHIRGKVGTWITLAEWARRDDKYVPVLVRTAQIDGEVIKADTWYQLFDGEFAEVKS